MHPMSTLGLVPCTPPCDGAFTVRVDIVSEFCLTPHHPSALLTHSGKHMAMICPTDPTPVEVDWVRTGTRAQWLARASAWVVGVRASGESLRAVLCLFHTDVEATVVIWSLEPCPEKEGNQ